MFSRQLVLRSCSSRIGALSRTNRLLAVTTYYTTTHEWTAFDDAAKTATVGITDHAQESLGDITFISLPVEGDNVTPENPLGNIESVKAVADVFSPVAGTVAEVNGDLVNENQWSLVNSDPESKGWLVKLKDVDPAGLGSLMTKDKYDEFLKGTE
eukprot:PhM_4_TR2009/c0_g2_i1/m.2994/K02437/gcvH, GCSH; glycine cleavage system H protein